MSCYGLDGAPIPCGGYTVYNSYVTDPLYASYYLYAWAGMLAVSSLFALPSMYSYARSGRWLEGGILGKFGLYENLDRRQYQPLTDEVSETQPQRTVTRGNGSMKTSRWIVAVVSLAQKFSRSTLPLPIWINRLPLLRPRSADASCHPTRPLFPFTLGTLLLALLIPAFIFAALFPSSELVANPNRFGFIALASLPPLFLLSSKSSPVAWLTGHGWTAVNFLHRWLGRSIVLLVFLHAYFWTTQYIATKQVTEFLSGQKQIRGITAFAFLLLIAVSSAKPIRAYAYSLFFVLHYVGIIGFLTFVNRHTVYAGGYATYAIVAIYGLDIIGRLSSMRIRYVEVEAMEGGMTRVGLCGIHGGWRAGEHVSLRLFFAPPSLSFFSAFRLFEAHPFSIANAPASVGILTSPDFVSEAEEDTATDAVGDRGANLYIRACAQGSWTSDLYETARLASVIATALPPVPSTDSSVAVGPQKKDRKRLLYLFALVEGPYGGIGPYTEYDQDNVLLVAGGGGMSFVLGILDEIVGRRVKSRRGGKIQIVWAVRERAHMAWFEKSLKKILDAASKSNSDLSVTLRVYITCDPTLTTLSPTSPTPALYDTAPSSSNNIDSSKVTLPHTLLLYSRPSLTHLLDETIDAALAPCGKCWPICHCGDESGRTPGICGNEEGGCCSASDARSIRSLRIIDGEKKAGGCCSDGDDHDSDAHDAIEEELRDVLTDLPSCCGRPSTTTTAIPSITVSNEYDSDSDTVVSASLPSSASLTKKTGCCAPAATSFTSSLDATPPKDAPGSTCGGCCASTGAGCCSGAIVGEDEEKSTGPRRILNGGLGIVVCGPGGMMRELRQAVSEVSLGKATRIGGIDLHAEHFSL